MGKNVDKKRPRISSSSSDTESIEVQDGAYIKIMLTEYQDLIVRLTVAIEDNTKIHEERILNLEA